MISQYSKSVIVIKTIFALVVILVLLFSIRGKVGNPIAAELQSPEWKDEGPFELSPDRGRFALTYSIIEDSSLSFSNEIASFAMPDVADNKGKFVSLFAPTVSFIVMPGYLLGKYLGISQVGTFTIVALFALLNIILIRSIAIKLGAHPIAATIAALLFLFASPAYSYAVTLYQHHISTFIILLSIYCLIKWNNFWSLCAIWFLCGLSISVDNPNLFLMFPIGLSALFRIISASINSKKVMIEIRAIMVPTILVALIPLTLFLYFNKLSYGNPFQLAGTVASAHISQVRLSTDVADELSQQFLEITATSSGLPAESNNKKSALGFFKTRNLPLGIFEHLLSRDRGMLTFTPIMLIGLLGLAVLYKNKTNYGNLLLAIIGINILLYSMWGDPYGGWAFGSRYLIPTYALCGIMLALVLTQWRHKIWLLLFVFVIAMYSLGVNTIGALTSNRNPPKVEVLALEAITGRPERYSFDRNIEMLAANRSKSFVFNQFLFEYLSAGQFAGIVIGVLATLLSTQFVALYLFKESKSRSKNKK